MTNSLAALSSATLSHWATSKSSAIRSIRSISALHWQRHAVVHTTASQLASCSRTPWGKSKAENELLYQDRGSNLRVVLEITYERGCAKPWSERETKKNTIFMTLFISRTRMLVPGCFIIVYYFFYFFFLLKRERPTYKCWLYAVLSGGSWLSLAGFGCIVHMCVLSYAEYFLFGLEYCKA